MVSSDTSSSPLVQVVGVDHLVLRVRDPLASVSWYQRTLGLQPVRIEEFKAKQVPFPSVRITPSFLIDFFPREEAQSRDETGAGRHMDHFCLEVSNTDISNVKDKLETAGVTVLKQFDGYVVKRFGARGNATSMYVQDPDGYVVELRSY